MSERDRKLQEIADKFKRDMQGLGVGVSMGTTKDDMFEVIPPPCKCGHVHANGRSGSCSKFTCACTQYREAGK